MRTFLMTALLTLIGAGRAIAQDAPSAVQTAALQTAALAATCAACHGTTGHALQGSVVPGLAARPASELRDQMLAFKRGTRTGTIMPQLARGYDEAQIDRLAGYFAGQPGAPSP